MHQNIKEYEIHTVCDLVSIVKLLPPRKTFWFRGHSDQSYPLIPSVQREGLMEKEQFLANDFYMKASVTLRDKPDFRSYSDWLTIMQHFGLPTRLLDWSRSPLVAAYFATCKWEKKPHVDGCIWILNPQELNESEGFNRYLYSIDSSTAEQMIHPAFKKEYVPEKEHVIDKILACYPIDHNLRVYVQQSAFTLHNTERKLEEIATPSMLAKIIIPSQDKEIIFRELNSLGITLSYIYPDSEHIAMEVTDRYEKGI